MKLRFFACLLSLLTLTAAFTACADSASTTAETTAGAETTAAAEQTGEVILEPDLPDIKFDGEDFVFIVRGESYAEWASQDIYAEEQNAEPINDAVYTRNIYLEETYNIKIKQFGATDVGNQAKKSISAGSDDYAAVMAKTSESATITSQKLIKKHNKKTKMNYLSKS